MVIPLSDPGSSYLWAFAAVAIAWVLVRRPG